MKKIIILFLILFLNLGACFALPELIYSYPEYGIYFYFDNTFNAETFKKPKQVKPNDGYYGIFIYDKKNSAATFKLKDASLLDILNVGIINKPAYFAFRRLDEQNTPIVNLCKLNFSNNTQVKFMINPETGKFQKQIEFNNGEIGIISMCNVDYLPWSDI